jgi:hypothetical protein
MAGSARLHLKMEGERNLALLELEKYLAPAELVFLTHSGL